MKRTPIRSRGRRGSAFPHRRDRDYWEWLLFRLWAAVPCDACGVRRARVRAHLEPRGRGGDDRNNIVLLCDGPGDTCHRKQEKRTGAFIEETGVDLYARARAWTERYDAERDLPF